MARAITEYQVLPGPSGSDRYTPLLKGARNIKTGFEHNRRCDSDQESATTYGEWHSESGSLICMNNVNSNDF